MIDVVFFLFSIDRAIAPRLTLYLTQDQSPVFHAVFLENLTCAELGQKLAALVQLPDPHVLDVFVEGPCGIHVLVTDEVVQNVKDESMYTVELLPGPYPSLFFFFFSTIDILSLSISTISPSPVFPNLWQFDPLGGHLSQTVFRDFNYRYLVVIDIDHQSITSVSQSGVI